MMLNAGISILSMKYDIYMHAANVINETVVVLAGYLWSHRSTHARA